MKASSLYNTKTIRMKMSLLYNICTHWSHMTSQTWPLILHQDCFSALLGCELPAELMCLSKSSSLIFPLLSFFSRRVSLKSSFKSSLSTSDSCEHTSLALRLYIGFLFLYTYFSNVVKMWIQKEKNTNNTPHPFFFWRSSFSFYPSWSSAWTRLCSWWSFSSTASLSLSLSAPPVFFVSVSPCFYL